MPPLGLYFRPDSRTVEGCHNILPEMHQLCSSPRASHVPLSPVKRCVSEIWKYNLFHSGIRLRICTESLDVLYAYNQQTLGRNDGHMFYDFSPQEVFKINILSTNLNVCISIYCTMHTVFKRLKKLILVLNNNFCGFDGSFDCVFILLFSSRFWLTSYFSMLDQVRSTPTILTQVLQWIGHHKRSQ